MRSNLGLIRGDFLRYTLFAILQLGLLSGCSDLMEWKEEVKLSDGRVVQITQKHRCTGRCVTNEAWITVKLPETGNKEVTWHEGLKPMILNVHEGKAYIVARPTTSYAWRVYGRPEPYYVTYRWSQHQWERIPTQELPIALHGTNLLIDPGNLKRNAITVTEKGSDAFNGFHGYRSYQKLVDLNHRSVFYQEAKTQLCTWDATNTVCAQNKSFSK